VNKNANLTGDGKSVRLGRGIDKVGGGAWATGPRLNCITRRSGDDSWPVLESRYLSPCPFIIVRIQKAKRRLAWLSLRRSCVFDFHLQSDACRKKPFGIGHLEGRQGTSLT